jgi:hypothetical protein
MEILSYLKKHPQAKDTLEGITGWWLLREWRDRNEEEVERAVRFLISEGLVLKTQVKGCDRITA